MSESLHVDRQWMHRALSLAVRGEGAVEPNPMVGCVIVRGGQVVGEGWHQRFGGPHAEIEALRRAATAARGATMYVTLEPCCHYGKTPPCCSAILASGLQRVVVARQDLFPQVAGRGLEILRQAGLAVECGVLEDEARELTAPYDKRLRTGLPWIIAKWAMTWDGKLATARRDSRWISNDMSRAIAHRLRGRVDAILVGRGTVEADDPQLTARPAGPRTALRVVLDSQARMSTGTQLARTAHAVPVLVAAARTAPASNVRRLAQNGCEVWLGAEDPQVRLRELLVELGRRELTNLLVEGGQAVFGSCFDADLVDEVHVFLAPKIVGGAAAPSPVGGSGRTTLERSCRVGQLTYEMIQGDLYARGRLLPACGETSNHESRE